MALSGFNAKKTAMPFFFLDAEGPGPSFPGSFAAPLFDTIHQRDGLGHCAGEGTPSFGCGRRAE